MFSFTFLVFELGSEITYDLVVVSTFLRKCSRACWFMLITIVAIKTSSKDLIESRLQLKIPTHLSPFYKAGEWQCHY
jgi:hypothetical protein